jgi:hypothetical protein
MDEIKIGASDIDKITDTSANVIQTSIQTPIHITYYGYDYNTKKIIEYGKRILTEYPMLQQKNQKNIKTIKVNISELKKHIGFALYKVINKPTKQWCLNCMNNTISNPEKNKEDAYSCNLCHIKYHKDNHLLRHLGELLYITHTFNNPDTFPVNRKFEDVINEQTHETNDDIIISNETTLYVNVYYAQNIIQCDYEPDTIDIRAVSDTRNIRTILDKCFYSPTINKIIRQLHQLHQTIDVKSYNFYDYLYSIVSREYNVKSKKDIIKTSSIYDIFFQILAYVQNEFITEYKSSQNLSTLNNYYNTTIFPNRNMIIGINELRLKIEYSFHKNLLEHETFNLSLINIFRLIELSETSIPYVKLYNEQNHQYVVRFHKNYENNIRYKKAEIDMGKLTPTKLLEGKNLYLLFNLPQFGENDYAYIYIYPSGRTYIIFNIQVANYTHDEFIKHMQVYFDDINTNFIKKYLQSSYVKTESYANKNVYPIISNDMWNDPSFYNINFEQLYMPTYDFGIIEKSEEKKQSFGKLISEQKYFSRFFIKEEHRTMTGQQFQFYFSPDKEQYDIQKKIEAFIYAEHDSQNPRSIDELLRAFIKQSTTITTTQTGFVTQFFDEFEDKIVAYLKNKQAKYMRFPNFFTLSVVSGKTRVEFSGSDINNYSHLQTAIKCIEDAFYSLYIEYEGRLTDVKANNSRLMDFMGEFYSESRKSQDRPILIIDEMQLLNRMIHIEHQPLLFYQKPELINMVIIKTAYLPKIENSLLVHNKLHIYIEAKSYLDLINHPNKYHDDVIMKQVRSYDPYYVIFDKMTENGTKTKKIKKLIDEMDFDINELLNNKEHEYLMEEMISADEKKKTKTGSAAEKRTAILDLSIKKRERYMIFYMIFKFQKNYIIELMYKKYKNLFTQYVNILKLSYENMNISAISTVTTKDEIDEEKLDEPEHDTTRKLKIKHRYNDKQIRPYSLLYKYISHEELQLMKQYLNVNDPVSPFLSVRDVLLNRKVSLVDKHVLRYFKEEEYGRPLYLFARFGELESRDRESLPWKFNVLYFIHQLYLLNDITELVKSKGMKFEKDEQQIINLNDDFGEYFSKEKIDKEQQKIGICLNMYFYVLYSGFFTLSEEIKGKKASANITDKLITEFKQKQHDFYNKHFLKICADVLILAEFKKIFGDEIRITENIYSCVYYFHVVLYLAAYFNLIERLNITDAKSHIYAEKLIASANKLGALYTTYKSKISNIKNLLKLVYDYLNKVTLNSVKIKETAKADIMSQLLKQLNPSLTVKATGSAQNNTTNDTYIFKYIDSLIFKRFPSSNGYFLYKMLYDTSQRNIAIGLYQKDMGFVKGNYFYTSPKNFNNDSYLIEDLEITALSKKKARFAKIVKEISRRLAFGDIGNLRGSASYLIQPFNLKESSRTIRHLGTPQTNCPVLDGLLVLNIIMQSSELGGGTDFNITKYDYVAERKKWIERVRNMFGSNPFLFQSLQNGNIIRKYAHLLQNDVRDVLKNMEPVADIADIAAVAKAAEIQPEFSEKKINKLEIQSNVFSSKSGLKSVEKYYLNFLEQTDIQIPVDDIWDLVCQPDLIFEVNQKSEMNTNTSGIARNMPIDLFLLEEKREKGSVNLDLYLPDGFNVYKYDKKNHFPIIFIKNIQDYTIPVIRRYENSKFSMNLGPNDSFAIDKREELNTQKLYDWLFLPTSFKPVLHINDFLLNPPIIFSKYSVHNIRRLLNINTDMQKSLISTSKTFVQYIDKSGKVIYVLVPFDSDATEATKISVGDSGTDIDERKQTNTPSNKMNGIFLPVIPTSPIINDLHFTIQKFDKISDIQLQQQSQTLLNVLSLIKNPSFTEYIGSSPIEFVILEEDGKQVIRGITCTPFKLILPVFPMLLSDYKGTDVIKSNISYLHNIWNASFFSGERNIQLQHLHSEELKEFMYEFVRYSLSNIPQIRDDLKAVFSPENKGRTVVAGEIAKILCKFEIFGRSRACIHIGEDAGRFRNQPVSHAIDVSSIPMVSQSISDEPYTYNEYIRYLYDINSYRFPEKLRIRESWVLGYMDRLIYEIINLPVKRNEIIEQRLKAIPFPYNFVHQKDVFTSIISTI